MRNFIKTTVAALVLGACAHADHPSAAEPDFLLRHGPHAQLLYLGVFHFHNQGLDSYKEQFPVDVLSPKRQAEIVDVVNQLAKYKPTRIGVEVPIARQGWVDSAYATFLAKLPVKPDGSRDAHSGASSQAGEVFQIGFRLAALLGHKRVYAIDAPPRSYEPEMTQEQWNARSSKFVVNDSVWDAAETAMYRYQDSLKTVRTLRDYFLLLNSPDVLRDALAPYLVGGFKRSAGDDYFGPDLNTTRWWNRNIRIFSNLNRITESANDRLLVIIGAGHVPILSHLTWVSPEYELVPLSKYLGH